MANFKLESCCPNCESLALARDSASPWIFFGASLLFPFGLLFFLLNRNVYCRDCGVRFRRLYRVYQVEELAPSAR